MQVSHMIYSRLHLVYEYITVITFSEEGRVTLGSMFFTYNDCDVRNITWDMEKLARKNDSG